MADLILRGGTVPLSGSASVSIRLDGFDGPALVAATTFTLD